VTAEGGRGLPDAHSQAEAVQQRIQPGRGVVHAEALVDDLGVDDLGDARSVQHWSSQPQTAAGGQRPPPAVGRHSADPVPGSDLAIAGALFDPLGRLQPHPFPPGVLFGGQPATIGIPHATGIAQAAPTVSGVWNLRR
jgi:hypothetical protein